MKSEMIWGTNKKFIIYSKSPREFLILLNFNKVKDTGQKIKPKIMIKPNIKIKPKIKTRKEIEEISRKLKKEGKVIVTCNGTFDLLHPGHVKFLKDAKEQGDILIVGLNSDSSIKKYKSKNRPIIPEGSRADVVSALECVDYVTIFEEKDPRELLSVIKPDVHVNGEEYGMDCIEAEVVRKNGGRLHLVQLFGDFSKTKLIQRILDDAQE